MKIISSKLIKTEERGTLTFWEIVFPWTQKKMFSYSFEIEVPADNLQLSDIVLGANHLKLLVINKLSETKFVLMATELHPCPPFIGVDIIVIIREFNKGSVKNELFCDKWKNKNIPFATEEFINEKDKA